MFHLGDVFVTGIDPAMAEATIRRFVKALFGDTKASPTKDEYGLYTATAASLRSADLSRQVGAAIFTKNGEIISLGCNEVPRPGGGTYWSDDEEPIYRDVELGYDPNQDRKAEIVHDLLTRMASEGFLSGTLTKIKSPQRRAELFIDCETLRDSQLMDIIEFGRVIHAEMSAIADAARLGRATKDATLFCTTFPCHICAKHVVAAGIDRVVFLEPYPKSLSSQGPRRRTGSVDHVGGPPRVPRVLQRAATAGAGPVGRRVARTAPGGHRSPRDPRPPPEPRRSRSPPRPTSPRAPEDRSSSFQVTCGGPGTAASSLPARGSLDTHSRHSIAAIHWNKLIFASIRAGPRGERTDHGRAAIQADR